MPHSLDAGRLVYDERHGSEAPTPALHLRHGSFGLGGRRRRRKPSRRCGHPLLRCGCSAESWKAGRWSRCRRTEARPRPGCTGCSKSIGSLADRRRLTSMQHKEQGQVWRRRRARSNVGNTNAHRARLRLSGRAHGKRAAKRPPAKGRAGSTGEQLLNTRSS